MVVETMMEGAGHHCQAPGGGQQDQLHPQGGQH